MFRMFSYAWSFLRKEWAERVSEFVHTHRPGEPFWRDTVVGIGWTFWRRYDVDHIDLYTYGLGVSPSQ